MSEEFMTPEEIDARFSLTRGTAKRWAKAGRLKAIELPGGLIRIRRNEVDALFTKPVSIAPVRGHMA